MKKFLLLVGCAVLFAGTASAQSLDQLFKVASKVAEVATGNNVNSSTICGEWKYVQPAVKLGSDNLLAQAGGAALSKTIGKKLNQYYEKVGIKAGSCTFTFAQDSTFTAQLASRTVSGKWSYSAQDEKVTLTVLNAAGYQLGVFSAIVYKTEGNLVLAFQANKILSFIQAVAARVNSSTANGIANLAKNYNEVALGFEFEQVKK